MGDRGVATRIEMLFVVGGRGGGVCVSVTSAWLSSFCQVRDLLLTCLQQFLMQAAPAAEVCHSVLPDLCIDV